MLGLSFERFVEGWLVARGGIESGEARGHEGCARWERRGRRQILLWCNKARLK